MQKLLCIVGPTASGKSDFGVQLAKQFKGEIISADSRQVYRGLDIGSGKITRQEMQGVPHHLLDVASPKRTYTVAQYQKAAKKTITSIFQRKHLPILVGGSAFYIYAVVDDVLLPEVKPNARLRKTLAGKSAQELYSQLKKLDPERAKTIDSKNSRRLIRALEIVLETGKPVPKFKKRKTEFEALLLGLNPTASILKERIQKRLHSRFKQGMVQEVANLHKAGLSWQRLESLGLEYRYCAKYLQKKISKKAMQETLQKEIEDFARRQMTWFKKDSRIHWIRDQKNAETIVKKFLAQ